MKKLTKNESEFLNKIYNFILTSEITERERKIGLLTKADIEEGEYVASAAIRLNVSLQKEAMRSGLSPTASNFYKEIGPLLDKILPLGTNRGSILFNNGYLD